MATLKAGMPIEPASGPARVLRLAAGAGATISLTGAAVGSAKAASRTRKTGRPASWARRCRRRVAVRSSRSGLPRSSTSTAAWAESRAASSATHSASASFGALESNSVFGSMPKARASPAA